MEIFKSRDSSWTSNKKNFTSIIALIWVLMFPSQAIANGRTRSCEDLKHLVCHDQNKFDRDYSWFDSLDKKIVFLMEYFMNAFHVYMQNTDNDIDFSKEKLDINIVSTFKAYIYRVDKKELKMLDKLYTDIDLLNEKLNSLYEIYRKNWNFDKKEVIAIFPEYFDKYFFVSY